MVIYIITINNEPFRAYTAVSMMWQQHKELCDTYELQGYVNTTFETGENLTSYTIDDTNTMLEHPITHVKIIISTRVVQLYTTITKKQV